MLIDLFVFAYNFICFRNIKTGSKIRHSKRYIESAGHHNERASRYENTAEELLNIDEDAIRRRYASRTGSITINPNAYSIARWRWNWAIRRILDLGKIYVTMNQMFGG